MAKKVNQYHAKAASLSNPVVSGAPYELLTRHDVEEAAKTSVWLELTLVGNNRLSCVIGKIRKVSNASKPYVFTFICEDGLGKVYSGAVTVSNVTVFAH